MPTRKLIPVPSAKRRGLTLIELLLALAIGCILAVIAVPAYQGYIADTLINQAILDIHGLEPAIQRYEFDQGHLPDSLADIGAGSKTDPWGNPYQYLRIKGADLKGKGQQRKDKNLVPVNSDYDLYSMGPDGDSNPPFTAKSARDDIVRCRNGQWVGVAEEY
jgi:general secretion pathway protein G